MSEGMSINVNQGQAHIVSASGEEVATTQGTANTTTIKDAVVEAIQEEGSPEQIADAPAPPTQGSMNPKLSSNRISAALVMLYALSDLQAEINVTESQVVQKMMDFVAQSSELQAKIAERKLDLENQKLAAAVAMAVVSIAVGVAGLGAVAANRASSQSKINQDQAKVESLEVTNKNQAGDPAGPAADRNTTDSVTVQQNPNGTQGAQAPADTTRQTADQTRGTETRADAGSDAAATNTDGANRNEKTQTETTDARKERMQQKSDAEFSQNLQVNQAVQQIVASFAKMVESSVNMGVNELLKNVEQAGIFAKTAEDLAKQNMQSIAGDYNKTENTFTAQMEVIKSLSEGEAQQNARLLDVRA